MVDPVFEDLPVRPVFSATGAKPMNPYYDQMIPTSEPLYQQQQQQYHQLPYPQADPSYQPSEQPTYQQVGCPSSQTQSLEMAGVREGKPKGWSTVLVIAPVIWGTKPVPRGHILRSSSPPPGGERELSGVPDVTQHLLEPVLLVGR